MYLFPSDYFVIKVTGYHKAFMCIPLHKIPTLPSKQRTNSRLPTSNLSNHCLILERLSCFTQLEISVAKWVNVWLVFDQLVSSTSGEYIWFRSAYFRSYL